MGSTGRGSWRTRPAVYPLRPPLLVEGLDGGNICVQVQLGADIAVHVAVGHMVEDLTDRQATGTVRGVESAGGEIQLPADRLSRPGITHGHDRGRGKLPAHGPPARPRPAERLDREHHSPGGLRAPGSWYDHVAGGKLYLWPKGDEPGEVYVPTLTDPGRRRRTPARGVDFTHLAICHGDREHWRAGDADR